MTPGFNVYIYPLFVSITGGGRIVKVLHGARDLTSAPEMGHA